MSSRDRFLMFLTCATFGLAGGAISNLLLNVSGVTANQPSVVRADRVIAKSVSADQFLLGIGPITEASLKMSNRGAELTLSPNDSDDFVLNRAGLSWKGSYGR